jgi:phospholipid-binding lipoprotein MlaA
VVTVTAILFCSNAQGEGGVCYQTYDPFENFNRGVFNLNQSVDHGLIKPLVKTYYYFMPNWGQNKMMNFFRNLTEPVSFLNYLAQGDAQNTSKTFWRFLINTTFGLAGLFDPASKIGLYVKRQTFDDTLAYYKMNYGAYLVLPIIGPSTTRTFCGAVLDTLVDPIAIAIPKKSYTLDYEVAYFAYKRVKYDPILDTIEESSLDQYVKMRDLYIQSLAAADPNCAEDQSQIDYENPTP